MESKGWIDIQKRKEKVDWTMSETVQGRKLLRATGPSTTILKAAQKRFNTPSFKIHTNVSHYLKSHTAFSDTFPL